MKSILPAVAIVLFLSCQKNIEFVSQISETITAIPLQSNANIAKYDITDADYIVANTQELLNALQFVQPGEIVFIEGSANLKIEDEISIPAGIVLASDRNANGSLGARIYRIEKEKKLWMKVMGDNVEISGLRFEGPHTAIDSTNVIKGIAIDGFQNLNVNNCELLGFTRAAVSLENATATITNNYIHHNRMCKEGYGVLLEKNSEALIEHNIFDFNRHDIAGTGHCAQSYEARYNLVLPNGTDHSFDMHCEHENEKNNSTCAGNRIDIHHNTFMNINHDAIMIRGFPQESATINLNTFYHATLDDAIKQYLRDGSDSLWVDSKIEYPFQSISLDGNLYINNSYSGNPLDIIILDNDNVFQKYVSDNKSFLSQTPIQVGHDFNYEDYLAANWTGNGTSDLIARNTQGALKLYPFVNGSFYNSSNIGTQVGHGFNYEDYFVGNWTGNGTSDLIAMNANGQLHLYKFNGSTFYGQGNPTTVGHGFGNYEEFFVGNWTGNGTSDLIAMNANGELHLYQFNGSSFYGQGNPTTVGHGFGSYEKLIPGNWSGNGTTDLMAMNTSREMLLYQFNGSSFYGQGNPTVVGHDFNYAEFDIGDFTGDDIDDLIVIDDNNSIFLYPFENNTFYGNGGPIKIAHNQTFKEFLVGQWGN